MNNFYSKISAQGIVWQVSALCHAIADTLEQRFNPVTVQGEITGFARAVSGHCYFTLKDEGGQIRCAMFRRVASLLDFSPQDGGRVQLVGRVTLYGPKGDFQLVVEGMRRSGQGLWFENFLKLKAKLEMQGLFDPVRKRRLPAMPCGIGVVTSLGAAALHDVLTTLQRRVPHIPVVIAPAAVQGVSAPVELVGALSALYAFASLNTGSFKKTSIDVILLVRGGGAMEDLWAFNDEDLAHAIAQSPVPVITGLGHETDFTIADFVADMRAPTPTAAAELVAEPQEHALRTLEVLEARIRSCILRRLDTHHQGLDMLAAQLGRPSARLNQRSLVLMLSAQKLKTGVQSYLSPSAQNLYQLQLRMPEKVQRYLQRKQEGLDRVGNSLALLDPSLVLKRGYAWVHRADNPMVPVLSAHELALDQELVIHLAQGRVGAKVSAKP